MKIRNGFVSNSSSESFQVSRGSPIAGWSILGLAINTIEKYPIRNKKWRVGDGYYYHFVFDPTPAWRDGLNNILDPWNRPFKTGYRIDRDANIVFETTVEGKLITCAVIANPQI